MRKSFVIFLLVLFIAVTLAMCFGCGRKPVYRAYYIDKHHVIIEKR